VANTKTVPPTRAQFHPPRKYSAPAAPLREIVFRNSRPRVAKKSCRDWPRHLLISIPEWGTTDLTDSTDGCNRQPSANAQRAKPTPIHPYHPWSKRRSITRINSTKVPDFCTPQFKQRHDFQPFAASLPCNIEDYCTQNVGPLLGAQNSARSKPRPANCLRNRSGARMQNASCKTQKSSAAAHVLHRTSKTAAQKKSAGRRSGIHYAALPAMIEALWPPKPKLLLITARSWRSRGVFGV